MPVDNRPMPVKAQAIVLAAGRGTRMRPLTDTCPKPLLQVRCKPLMRWALDALARGGVERVVVNTDWLGEQIEQAFGAQIPGEKAVFHGQNDDKKLSNSEPLNPSTKPSLTIAYSHEGRDFGAALETAGGISRALPLLDDVFWVLAGDVFAPDFEFAESAVNAFKISGRLAHLWLVPNPEHNPLGDFGLAANGLALNLPKDAPHSAPHHASRHTSHTKFTYSTIGLYHKRLFAPPWCDVPPGNPVGVKAALAPLLRSAMDQGHVSAELYTGRWVDVGTPQRLDALNRGENAP